MSTRVLVIPEDPKFNGYILKPVLAHVLEQAGRPSAQLTILPRSRLTGLTNAVRAIRNDLAGAWRWMDLWLFTPDADRTNPQALQELENEMARQEITLFCCAAVPEVEAWLLAGHHEKITVPWTEAVANPHFKEEVFIPFLERYGSPKLPGMGREKLTLDALQRYPTMKRFCPEIAQLEARLRRFFSRP